METQAFSVFLEERKWPSSDLFDELISSRKYKQEVSLLVSSYRELQNVSIDQPRFTSPKGVHTYACWPDKLNNDAIKSTADPVHDSFHFFLLHIIFDIISFLVFIFQVLLARLKEAERPPAPPINFTLRAPSRRGRMMSPEAGYELKAIREKVAYFVSELLSEKVRRRRRTKKNMMILMIMTGEKDYLWVLLT